MINLHCCELAIANDAIVVVQGCLFSLWHRAAGKRFVRVCVRWCKAKSFLVLILCYVLIGLVHILLLFQVAKVCTNCGVNMGEYFCEVCKFYDDDVISLSQIQLFEWKIQEIFNKFSFFGVFILPKKKKKNFVVQII